MEYLLLGDSKIYKNKIIIIDVLSSSKPMVQLTIS